MVPVTDRVPWFPDPSSLNTMDSISTALSYCYETTDYSSSYHEDSNGLYETVTEVTQGPAYPSHGEVVDILLHTEAEVSCAESAVDYSDYYSAHAQCFSLDTGGGQGGQGQEAGGAWGPEYSFHMPSLSPAQSASSSETEQKPRHNILLQRTHKKRSKVCGGSRAGAGRFEDPGKREQYKRAACERERTRMKDCNKIFTQLREGLPLTRASGKRLSKIETLRMAIKYIKHLKTVLSYPVGHHVPDHVLTFDPSQDQ